MLFWCSVVLLFCCFFLLLFVEEWFVQKETQKCCSLKNRSVVTRCFVVLLLAVLLFEEAVRCSKKPFVVRNYRGVLQRTTPLCFEQHHWCCSKLAASFCCFFR